MKEIKLTQGQVAIVDDEDFEYLNQFNWSALKRKHTFYAFRRSSSKNGNKATTIRMHREIMKAAKGEIIDHKDFNGLNNQKNNLRSCDYFQSNAYKNSHKGSSSKFLGVSIFKRSNKFLAQIQSKGKHYFLGHFSSETEAANAYNEKAKELFGEFANLNRTESADKIRLTKA